MSGKEFTTSGGRSIKIDPAFFDFQKRHVYFTNEPMEKIREANINNKGGIEEIDYEAIDKKFKVTGKRSINLVYYIKAAATAFQAFEMMRSAGVGKLGRGLDIGCGSGVHVRLLKAWGAIAAAEGIDLYDICTSLDEGCLIRRDREFRYILRIVEWYQDRIRRKPVETRSQIERAIVDKVDTTYTASSSLGYRPPKDIFSTKFQVKPTIDKYVSGNFFEITEKFDFVSLFDTLDWLPADEAFNKFADLVDPGGYVFIRVSNHWSPTNPSKVFGYFPYAGQRLSDADFSRYAEEFHPENADDLIAQYRYSDPARPTADDYVDIAARNGFVLTAFETNICPFQVRSKLGLTPLGLAEHQMSALHEVVDDMREHKPGIQFRDVLPISYCMLFRRVDMDRTLDETTYGALDKELQPWHFESSNPIVKTARNLLVKILRRR